MLTLIGLTFDLGLMQNFNVAESDPIPATHQYQKFLEANGNEVTAIKFDPAYAPIFPEQFSYGVVAKRKVQCIDLGSDVLIHHLS